MLEAVTRSEQQSRYLKTASAKHLLEWDAQIGTAFEDCVDVYFFVGWRDITRSLQAAELLDRELRRGSRAVLDAYGDPGARGLVPFSPSEVLRALETFPQPQHASSGGLDVVAASSSPLAFRLRPTGDTTVLLQHAAASMVGYSMAAFGRPFRVRWTTGHRARKSDLKLSAVRDFARYGAVNFSILEELDLEIKDISLSLFKAVSSPPALYFGFEVQLVVIRSKGDYLQIICGSL